MVEHVATGGTTGDLAEITVDYKNKTVDIKDVPPPTVLNRVFGTLVDIGFSNFMIFFLFLIVIILVLPFSTEVNTFLRTPAEQVSRTMELKPLVDSLSIYILTTHFALLFCVSLLSINKKVDRKIKRYFAIKSGKGKRNKITLTSLNSREFVIPNTQNRVVDYEVSGDFRKFLDKVMIKKEESFVSLLKQGTVTSVYSKKHKRFWNVYFLFDKTPRKGSLYVEWI